MQQSQNKPAEHDQIENASDKSMTSEERFEQQMKDVERNHGDMLKLEKALKNKDKKMFID